MRSLVFHAGGRPFAIDLRSVLAVQTAPVLGAPPGSPAGVLGVVAWRGDVVTVVAAPGVDAPGAGEGSLVRLAPPREHLALWIPGGLDLVDHPGPEARPLDPASIG